MASKKSTNISLSILALAGALAVAYFIWLFLAPPPATTLSEHVISTDIDKRVIETGPLKDFRPYVSLPIKGGGTIGRDNPFMPFLTPALETSNVNNGINPGGSTTTAPLMNLPDGSNNNGLNP